MDPNKEMRFAVGLAVVLLIIGVFCYAAFSAKAPEEPIRMMFTASAGKVLFQHKIHTVPSGYGASCYDCHHHPEEDEAAIRACGDCHDASGDLEGVMATCMECHYEDEIEGYEISKRGDAFHNQCINCHKDFGNGPLECTECHVM